MNTYIGIDLGTSGVKLLLVDKVGRILNEVNISYPLYSPQEGYNEQNPSDYFDATISGVKKLLLNQDKNLVKGISFGGQMHGLVVLDKNDKVIRPCILWNDSRSEKQTDYLNEVIGKENLSKYTGNIAFAGFMAPKILWLKENEEENFRKITKIMLPKDYLAYKLSGVFATDYSDASGMLLLDVNNRRYSKNMCDICNINVDMLPKLYESYEIIGNLKQDIANEVGLSSEVKIIIGAGDNAAAAIGTGTVNNGDCNISLGTSGTIFVSSDNFSIDSKNALHSFCHANGKFHLMGCILSAASARKWWLEDILNTHNYKLDEEELAKETNVIFLPYLSGERSPHNDVNAKGSFINLTSSTTKGELSLAIMEGVAFALKDCLEIAKLNGVQMEKTRLCGGGAKSKRWRQIVSDTLNIPVEIIETEQGPSYGAAILAMVGCKEYSNVNEATSKIIKVKETIIPNENNVESLNFKYEKFKKLYPLLKDIF